ncbi:adenylyltransferase/cytidyltransferase family protein [Lachnospiraceae bacterium ZAX-1]
MIRFCDMEVWVMNDDIEDIECRREGVRDELFYFFHQEGNEDKILFVNNECNEFQGLITYRLLLEAITKDSNHYIQREFVKADEQLFYHAKQCFATNPNIQYLPVLDKNNDVIYFCYNDYLTGVYDRIEACLTGFESKDQYLFIEDVYPNIEQVCIHGFNEWAFRIYHILKKRNVSVSVYGEQWELLLGITNVGEEAYVAEQTFDIWAESAPEQNDICNQISVFLSTFSKNSQQQAVLASNIDFLSMLATINAEYIECVVSAQLKKRGHCIFLAYVPSYEQLKTHTSFEEARYSKMLLSFKSTKIATVEQIKRVYGMTGEEIEKRNSQNPHYAEGEWNTKVIQIQDESFVLKQSVKYKRNRLYLIGPCIVDGSSLLLEDSFVSLVQEYLDFYQLDYSIAVSVISNERYHKYKDFLESLARNKNDIIVCIRQGNHRNVDRYLDLTNHIDIDFTDVYNKRPLKEEYFFDEPIHSNGKANRAMVKEMFEKHLIPSIESMDFSEEEAPLQKMELLTKDGLLALEQYLHRIERFLFRPKRPSTIGAIVMNCNPITLGHQYLIETAKTFVDYLYIFIVEEDRSFFPFKDRLHLAREAVSQLKNVSVIPSGAFILSYRTFPSYFEKEESRDIKIDAAADIELFATYIAPALNIQVRFVGQEPFDKITEQYNRQMELQLEDYGIRFLEIPRKEVAGQAISASRVRTLLERREFDKIRLLVPDSTYDYLVDFQNRDHLRK